MEEELTSAREEAGSATAAELGTAVALATRQGYRDACAERRAAGMAGERSSLAASL